GYEADAEWKGWQYQNWRPEDYGLLITTLGYAQLVRETRASLADPGAMVSMPLLEASAEKNCVLGNWLRGEGADRYSGHVRYGVVQSLHHQLHEVAREATRLKVLGRQEEANAHIMEINILAEAIQSEFREWMEERSRPWKFES
ncbi:MAG: CZB domain-containing protein, partial [Betaproteobacteria bacterium]|nr:CZB domain-containing protein [Betaproteobacteria bacterium]